MSLPREYRVREVYLKTFEELFPTERVRKLINYLEECDSKVSSRLSRLPSPKEKGMPEAVFYAYVYTLLESLILARYRISPLKDLKRFERDFGQTSFSNPSDEDTVLEALSYSRVFDALDDESVRVLVLSITLFRTFLNDVQEFALARFSSKLKEYTLYQVGEMLDDETYQKKVRIFGQLLQTSTNDTASSIEAIRLGLQCLPSGNQTSANLLLYILVRTFGIWPEMPRQLLHVPVDVDVRRVIGRIGMTQARLGKLEYGGVSYLAVQMLAKRLAPEDPALLYGLKYVSKIWCKPRSTDCEDCPMNEVCSFAETISL